MDLQDESRTVVISGDLARKQGTGMDWGGWNDFFVVLMDNCRKFGSNILASAFTNVAG